MFPFEILRRILFISVTLIINEDETHEDMNEVRYYVVYVRSILK